MSSSIGRMTSHILWKIKKCSKPPTRKLFKTKPTSWHLAVPTQHLLFILDVAISDLTDEASGSAQQRHDVHWGRNHGAMRLKKRQEMFVLILDAVCLHSHWNHWNQAPASGYVHLRMLQLQMPAVPRRKTQSKNSEFVSSKKVQVLLWNSWVALFFLVPSQLRKTTASTASSTPLMAPGSQKPRILSLRRLTFDLSVTECQSNNSRGILDGNIYFFRHIAHHNAMDIWISELTVVKPP